MFDPRIKDLLDGFFQGQNEPDPEPEPDRSVSAVPGGLPSGGRIPGSPPPPRDFEGTDYERETPLPVPQPRLAPAPVDTSVGSSGMQKPSFDSTYNIFGEERAKAEHGFKGRLKQIGRGAAIGLASSQGAGSLGEILGRVLGGAGAAAVKPSMAGTMYEKMMVEPRVRADEAYESGRTLRDTRVQEAAADLANKQQTLKHNQAMDPLQQDEAVWMAEQRKATTAKANRPIHHIVNEGGATVDYTEDPNTGDIAPHRFAHENPPSYKKDGVWYGENGYPALDKGGKIIRDPDPKTTVKKYSETDIHKRVHDLLGEDLGQIIQDTETGYKQGTGRDEATDMLSPDMQSVLKGGQVHHAASDIPTSVQYKDRKGQPQIKTVPVHKDAYDAPAAPGEIERASSQRERAGKEAHAAHVADVNRNSSFHDSKAAAIWNQAYAQTGDESKADEAVRSAKDTITKGAAGGTGKPVNKVASDYYNEKIQAGYPREQVIQMLKSHGMEVPE